MNEELYVTFTPEGRPIRMVKSQLWKHGGKDPFTGKQIIKEAAE